MYSGTRDDKFSNITRYMEHEDKQLHRVLSNLSIIDALGAKTNGVTFLFPRDRSVDGMRAQIIKSAFEGNHHSTIKLINNCIITSYIPTLVEFSNNNLKYNNGIPVVIHANADGKVTLTNGLTITRDNNFKLLHNHAKFAVYNIVSGKPITETKPEDMSFMGGYDGGAPAEMVKKYKGNKNARSKILQMALEADSTSDEDNQYGKGTSKMLCIANSFMASLNEDDNKYQVVHAPMPWAFAFVFRWLIPNTQLNKWLGADDVGSTCQKYRDTMKRYTRNDEFQANRESVRMMLLKNIGVGLAKKVEDVYNAFVKGGEYEGVSLASGADFEVVDKDSSIKLAYDECAYIASSIEYQKGDANNIIRTLSEVFLSGTNATPWLADSNKLSKGVGSPNEILCLIVKFIRSPWFLYVSGTGSKYTGGAIEGIGGRPDCTGAYADDEAVQTKALENTTLPRF